MPAQYCGQITPQRHSALLDLGVFWDPERLCLLKAGSQTGWRMLATADVDESRRGERLACAQQIEACSQKGKRVARAGNQAGKTEYRGSEAGFNDICVLLQPDMTCTFDPFLSLLLCRVSVDV